MQSLRIMARLVGSERNIPPGRIGKGAGVAVLFNPRARRVTPEVIEAVRRALPDATVVVPSSLAESERELMKLAHGNSPVRLLLSAGGDGTVAELINGWCKSGVPIPPLGLLPFGTGNAWAHATHAPKLDRLLEALPMLRWTLPTRRFALLDVGGRLCQFAGTGWDAKLLDDYERHRRSKGAKLLPRPLRGGLAGFLVAGLRFTVPEGLARARPEAVVTSTERSFAVTDDERVVEAVPGKLWQGRFSVLAMGTTPQYGFRFEAFPFSGEVAGMFNLRIYDQPLWRALPALPRLWRGAHPLPGMHDYFVRSVHIQVHPSLPFQVAGDAIASRQELDVRLADQTVDVVDWIDVNDT